MKEADGHRIKAILLGELFLTADIFSSQMTARDTPFISDEANVANLPSSCYDYA